MTDDIRWVKTHCARMDHGGCGLLVGVEGNQIVKIKGDPEGFLNRGYVCHKGRVSAERLTHPDRLKQPLKRIGRRGEGRWQPISWEEALQTVAAGLNETRAAHGARAVAFCQGMPKGLEHFVLIRLANLFGSPNLVAVQDVCHAPREVAGMHTCGFYPVADFHQKSALVVLWGSNVTWTNEEGAIHSLLLDQLRRGTDLMIVDPRRTELAERARFWLPLRPGTDHLLALAFLHVIVTEGLYDADFVAQWTHGFDQLAEHVRDFSPQKMAPLTDLPAELIRESARFYAQSRPAAIQWGNPIEQTVHNFDATRALVCLMAVCGNLDAPGGNIQANEPGILGLGPFVRADLLPNKRFEMIHAHHGAIPRLMTVPPAYFRQAVLSGEPYPVRAAYMQCTNPLLGYADSRRTEEALLALDFLAVADVFMTPTAALADVVLPAATHFEFDDIGHYGLGHGIILARPKVVDPPPECWSDLKILNELGKRTTQPEHWYDDPSGFLEMLLQPAGLTYREFVAKGYLTGPERFHKYRPKGFKTPTGKVELALSQAPKFKLKSLPAGHGAPPEEDPAFPLVLTSCKNRFYLHSCYRWVADLRRKSERPEAEIHPETAAACGIADGAAMVIETPHGAVTQHARVTDAVRPGVVFAAYGWWFPEKGAAAQFDWQSANFNMLTSTATLGREFGTPNLKAIACRVRPALEG
ncbi:MAG TPA: molybdopterin-dependent oxidoreductase [Desulfobacterales bacterium]|nr:molybdopterin-dependent oxidoreductase [Desulfobacterales bacterium]